MAILENKKLIQDIKDNTTHCECCGKYLVVKHGHHIIHTGFGGGKRIDVKENILIVCPDCHRKIHDGHIEIEKPILHDLELKYSKDIETYQQKPKKPVKRNVSISKMKVASNYNEAKRRKEQWERNIGEKLVRQLDGSVKKKHLDYRGKWV